MKPVLIEWIPIYGMFKYFKRYFKTEKRDFSESIIAQWFGFYHHVTGLIIILPIIFYFIFKVKL